MRWIRRACEAAAILAWLLLILRYQYGVSLPGSDESIDALFLAALAGIAIARIGEAQGAPAARRALLRIGLAGAATAVSLVAAEYAARFVFSHARSSGNARDYLSTSGKGPVVRANALGFRDREIPPKSAARYRIAVVGDSFTYGNALEESERFTNQLQDLLGAGYEVFNFGIPGDNLPEHLVVLGRALPTQPDFVLLQLYINDFEAPGMHRPAPYPLLPASLNRRLERSSLLYDLLRNQWVELQQRLGWSESYADFMKRHLSDPNSPDAAFGYSQLRAFFVKARAAGTRVGGVLFPAPDALGPHGRSYPFDYLHVGVQRVCTEEGVHCLDLLPLYSEFENARALWVSPFDAHPNARVSRLAAESIAAAFRSAWEHAKYEGDPVAAAAASLAPPPGPGTAR
jgi:hypothetical protein